MFFFEPHAHDRTAPPPFGASARRIQLFHAMRTRRMMTLAQFSLLRTYRGENVAKAGRDITATHTAAFSVFLSYACASASRSLLRRVSVRGLAFVVVLA